MDFKKANQNLIELAEKYQHIIYADIEMAVPYFINTAEQVYKRAMKEVGIEDEMMNKVVQLIMSGKTPLGSGGGKGSPEEITQDLARLMQYLNEQGYHPKKPVSIRRWMTEMHIGLDCSGYIYNIFNSIEKIQGENILNKLAWIDTEDRKRSHAGAFIFDSENLEKIEDFKNLRPLDILIFRGHTHVGILAEYQSNLCITDCSMGKNGITFSKLCSTEDGLTIDGSESWTEMLKNHEIVIRRLSS